MADGRGTQFPCPRLRKYASTVIPQEGALGDSAAVEGPLVALGHDKGAPVTGTRPVTGAQCVRGCRR